MLPEVEFAVRRLPIARLLAALVLYAMWAALTTWLVVLLKAFTHPQGSWIKRTVLLPLTAIAISIVYIVHAVGHSLSYAVSHSMPGVAGWMNDLATREIALNNAEGNFAEQTARGFERLTEVWVPREIRRETAPLRHGIDHLERDLPRLRARLEHFRIGIDRLLHDNIIPRVRANERAIAVTLPREIGRIRARSRAAERAISHPSKAWIKRIWKAGWVLVGAGLMVKFLVRKFPHLFCRNTTKGLRALCNSPAQLIDVLLGDALAAIALVDICDTIRAIELVADQFEPIIEQLVKAEDDFFDHCGHDLPSAADRPGYGGRWLATSL